MDSLHVLVSLSNTRNENTKYMILFHLFFLLCTTIRPKIRVFIDLFILFAHDYSIKIYGPLSFLFFCTIIRPKTSAFINLFLLFGYDHSTKIHGLFFSYSFFCARSFDQKLGSSFIYISYLYSTIRPKLGVILTL